MSEMIERAAGALLNVQENLAPDNPWGHRCIANNKAAPHAGDCTKMSFTCVRCMCEDAFKEVRAVIAAMGDPDAERDRLAEALRPFADHGALYLPGGHPNALLAEIPDDRDAAYGVVEDGKRRVVKIGDYRRAAAAMKQGSKS